MRLLLVVAAVSALAVGAAGAARCICACISDLRVAVAQADAAVIGTVEDLVASSPSNRIFTLRVEEVLKGHVDRRIQVKSSPPPCGLALVIGQRVGLLLRRISGEWKAGGCETASPTWLRHAAAPLPAPDGRPPAFLLVAVDLGDVHTVALDREGRTVAYGRGPGSPYRFAPCPGGRRSVEIAQDRTDETRLVVRVLPSLRILRDLLLPRAGVDHVQTLSCRAADAGEVLLAASGRLVRVRPGRITPVRRIPEGASRFSGGRLYVAAKQLVEIDLDSLRARRLARIPSSRHESVSDLAVSRDGRRAVLLVRHSSSWGGSGPPPRLLLLDLRTRRFVGGSTLPAGEAHGAPAWLGTGRIAVFGDREIRVYDLALRLRGRTRGWRDYVTPVVIGRRAFGAGRDGTLQTARLPGGRTRTFRRFYTDGVGTLAPATP